MSLQSITTSVTHPVTRTRTTTRQVEGPDGEEHTETVVERFIEMVTEQVTKLVQVPDPKPPQGLDADGGDGRLKDDELKALAEKIIKEAQSGQAAQAARTLANAMDTLPADQQQELVRQVFTGAPEAAGRILHALFPTSAAPSPEAQKVATHLGELFDSGALGRAQLDAMLGFRGAAPSGSFIPDPAGIMRALSASGSPALIQEATAALIAQAGKVPFFFQSIYTDAVLQQPIEEVLDAFAADPKMVDTFFDHATHAQEAQLMEAINKYQLAHRIVIGPGITAYTIPAARFEGMDRAYLRARQDGADDPRLLAATGSYVKENAERTAFIERAFLEPLRKGRVDDAFREQLHYSFLPLTMRGSHAVMQAIRDAGLLDSFLKATLRDDKGKAVDPKIFGGVKALMETGRLDVYAEILASMPITAHDPAVSGLSAKHHFAPDVPGVYMNSTISPMTGSADDIARTLAHELFHAYNFVHGHSDGAVNEGLGIAAIHYAFTDAPYSIAEAVYGSKSWYRDKEGQPKYPMGDFSGADAEMMELLVALTARDSSQIALFDPVQLQSDYDLYWSMYDRNDDAHWAANAAKAEADMLAARPKH